MAALGNGTAAIIGGALASGIAIGVYQVWRRARDPQPFGAEDLAYGVLFGSAIAVPLAVSHGLSTLTSNWIFGEKATSQKLAAFVALSLVFYLGAINRADQVLLAEGPGAAAHYFGSELALFGTSLAIASTKAALA